MKDSVKKVLKGAMALLSVALVVMLVTKVFDEMYDLRLVLAAAGGAFGYQPLCALFSKIKGLE